MSVLKGIRREIKDATGLRIKPEAIGRVIFLVDMGWNNAKIRSYAGKRFLGVEINYSTLTRIKENINFLRPIVCGGKSYSYDPMKELSIRIINIEKEIAIIKSSLINKDTEYVRP